MRSITIALAAAIVLIPIPSLAQSNLPPAICFEDYSSTFASRLALNLCRIQLLQQQAPAPSAPTRQSPPPSTEGLLGTIVTRKDNINLRAGNSLTSAVIGNIPSGTTLYVMSAILSKDGDNTSWRWVRVDSGEHKGKYGYVRDDLI